MLTGQVIDISSGRPMPGVVVSNGREAIRTDADGHYALPPPDAGRWIMLTTPAGYRPVEGWFRDLVADPGADLTFRLEPDPNRSGDTFTFAQVTDTHIGAYPGEWLAEDLRAIAAANDHPPAQCVIATGDASQSGKPEQMEAYLAACAESPLPVIHLVGNHDWSTDKSGETWSQHVGPLYFSLDWGPVHLVGYDSTANHYNKEMPVAAWCAADLALVPPERPVVMLIHHQLDEKFYAQWRTPGAHPPMPRIVASVSGHWHSSRLYHDGHTIHLNQPTTSMGGIDYSPRGYTVVQVRADGEVAVFRRLLGATRRARRTGVAAVPEPPTHGSDPGAPPVRVGSPWPQFHGRPLRDGRSEDAPSPPFFRRWQTRLPGGLLFGSPVIVGCAVYIAALDEENPCGGAVVALDAASGGILWQKPTHGSAKHTVTLWQHLVIAVTVHGRVIAMDRTTGEVAWTYQLGDPSRRWIFSAPLVAGNQVYAGHARHFVALDAATGKRVWLREDLQRTHRDDWISSYSSPAADEQNVYIGFFWHAEPVWALERETGLTRWVIEGPTAKHGPASTPVLDGEGGLYILCHDAKLRAYSTSEGIGRWEFDLQHEQGRRGGPGWSASTPALADGMLYVPTGDGAVRAISACRGEEVWQWWSDPAIAGVQAYARDGRSVLSSPVVAGNSVIVGASDGRIVALDRASGALLWADDLEAPVVSSPATSGNLLVCGASDGWVYAWTSGA